MLQESAEDKKCLSLAPRQPVKTIFRPNIEDDKKIRKLKITKIKKRILRKLYYQKNGFED